MSKIYIKHKIFSYCWIFLLLNIKEFFSVIFQHLSTNQTVNVNFLHYSMKNIFALFALAFRLLICSSQFSLLSNVIPRNWVLSLKGIVSFLSFISSGSSFLFLEQVSCWNSGKHRCYEYFIKRAHSHNAAILTSK